jgi:uncharacterized repeat protein (TIGR01451 family)
MERLDLSVLNRVLSSIWSSGVRLLALCVAALFSSAAAQAQITSCYGRSITALDFRSPVLLSGTALAVGAVYRFPNVAPGIDARVRINAFTGGATLTTIDNDAGLIGNFQPELAGANARSADFTITFVVAGGTTPVSLDFASSGVDIDGDSAAIREYSEFSTPFAAYVLDSPTRLSVNASGPSVATNIRFEATTTFTAPGIDETATQNIATILYTATSSFNYQIGTLGTGASTRLTSLDFGCPSLALPAPSTLVPQDFGDAPASYGNPIHDIAITTRMGATNTAELARYNSPTASGDTGDDGVTITQLRRSQIGSATITVTNAAGRLQGWIDWNGDGDFADAGEQIATNIADNGVGDANAAAGIIGLTIVTPAAPTLNPTFARFRWSTTSGLASSSTASNGEVEDYIVTILGPAVLIVVKSSTIFGNLFAIPGNDILYAITATNTGLGPADADSVFVLDSLPATVEFYNGDVDGAGPETGPVAFSQVSAGLSFSAATDLRYSNLVPAPANFAACTYTPSAGYDPAVRHVCFNPKGAMLAGSAPAPNFTVQFRTRIK